jgi:hypothetical protein
MIFFAVGTPIPLTFVSSESVEELTLTVTVVDLPGFLGVVEEGTGLRLGEGLGVTTGAGISVEAGVDPPPVPGIVKSWALVAGTPPGVEGIPPGTEGATLPGACGLVN